MSPTEIRIYHGSERRSFKIVVIHCTLYFRYASSYHQLWVTIVNSNCNMILKFTSFHSKDAYIFINEFQKVNIIIKLQYLSDDIIKLCFILFVLKTNAKSGCIACLLSPPLFWINLKYYFLKSIILATTRPWFVTKLINCINWVENLFEHIWNDTRIISLVPMWSKSKSYVKCIRKI